jgi:hypothetical protein
MKMKDGLKEFVTGFVKPMKKSGKGFTKEMMDEMPVKKPKKSFTKEFMCMK